MNRRAPAERQDNRLKATGLIWGPATGMLGICIPLVAIGGSEGIVLPVLVLLGATVSTVVIWIKGEVREAPLPEASRLQRLEERLANLETITTSTDLGLQERFKHLESKDH